MATFETKLPFQLGVKDSRGQYVSLKSTSTWTLQKIETLTMDDIKKHSLYVKVKDMIREVKIEPVNSEAKVEAEKQKAEAKVEAEKQKAEAKNK